MGERIEDLQFAGLRFIQNDQVFRFGTDAVLLASFCDVGRKDTVVDLGTGSGILPVLLYGRTKARLIGIELQQNAAELAKRNIELNGIGDRVSIIHGDLKRARELVKEKVTAVVCNPPYEKVGSGGVSKSDAHKIARHEVACNLEDVVKSACSLLQTGGRFDMLHRASRLAEILHLLKLASLEPKVMRFVAAEEGREPGYVLVKSIKDAAPSLRILPSLIVQDEGGIYTREMKEIYHEEV